MSEELPAHWTRTTLGAVIDGFDAGRNLKAHGRPAEGAEYGVLKISAVSWGAFNPRENKALLSGDAPRPREVVRNGDLLISRANTTELVGAVVRVDRDYPQLMLPDKVLRLRVRSDIIEPSFLLHALRRPDARAHLELNATGTSDSMRNLSQPKMEAVPLGLPPLPEQRRIVAKLESLQGGSRRAREALDAVPPLLEKLRQSILAAAFRGDLTKDWRAKNKDVEPATELLKRIRIERRKKWEESELAKMKAKGKAPTDARWKAKYREPEPVDTEGLPELPEGWCWASVEEMLARPEDLFDGPFGSALKSSDYTSSGARVIRLENVAHLEFKGDKETFVSLEKYQTLTRHTVRSGDIVFGSFVEETTRVCVLPALDGPTIAKADCFCIRPDARVLSVELLMFALGSQHARNELTQGIHGATRPRINTGQLRRLRVATPPRAEQAVLLERIETSLVALRRLRAVHSGSTANLPILDRGILAQAFRGELVPQDPNDEPVHAMVGHQVSPSASPPTRSARAAKRITRKKTKRTTRAHP